jgi:hypothetical protein
MMSIMLKTSDYIGTVSRAMKRRILAEPNVFRHAHLFAVLEAQGRFFGRRNGFHMSSRQRFWFRSKKSILEVYDKTARKRLYAKYAHAKRLAKPALQSDTNIRLRLDDEKTNHVIFSMLHRICKQKGFELLVDWKVYEDRGRRYVTYEPWKLMGQTVWNISCRGRPRFSMSFAGGSKTVLTAAATICTSGESPLCLNSRADSPTILKARFPPRSTETFT